MANSSWAALIKAYAKRYRVDPKAALAVASQEGLSGGVGDSGSSYGPFQLHVGGALPAGKGRAWAESPAGIDYAMRKIASVAGGLQGAQAVRAIVTQFERPANPSKEIVGALAAYGGNVGSSASVGSAGGTSGGQSLLQTLTAQIAQQPSVPNFSSHSTAFLKMPSGTSSAATSVPHLTSPTSTPNLAGAEQKQASTIQQQALKMLAGGMRPAGSPSSAGSTSSGVSSRAAQPLLTRGMYAVPASGRLIGTPYGGTHTLGNWESDNAVDISLPVGTPLRATANGVIGSSFGSLNSNNPRMQGLRLHLDTKGNEFYYAHLSAFAKGIKPGAQVKKGQIIGYSGSANGTAHLHLGVKNGDPQGLYK